MARGESLNARPVRVWPVFLVGAVSLGLFGSFAAFSLLTQTSPPPPAPAGGALAAFASVGPRDAAMAHGTRSLDRASARRTVDALLAARGYVPSETIDTSVRQMPFEVVPTELDVRCGLVVVLGERGAVIDGGGLGGARARLEAIDPSVFTFATCGDLPVHVDGAGGAVTRVWLHPGIEPACLGGNSMSADALLAHAEAEHLLRALAYEPQSEIIDVPLFPTGPGGFMTLAPPHIPTSGCMPFVAYVEGAGSATQPSTQSARAFSTVVGCGGANGWSLSLVDDATPGARAFVRAYGAGSGPSSTITIDCVTQVDTAHAAWPTPIAASPGP